MALSATCAMALVSIPGIVTVALAQTPKYSPTWESVTKHGYPQWFSNAKFGIYAHWGPYSVPAFGNEWYSRNMYVAGTAVNDHHRKQYGHLDNFGYKNFVPQFTASKFNASAWARLYRRSGAMYAGPVAEHADGFAMFPSKVSRWNAAEQGPRRDIVGEISAAVRSEGLKVIATLHHQWLWAWYPTFNTSQLSHDAGDPAYQLTPEHGGLYGPPVSSSAAFDCGFGGHSCNTTRAFQDYFLAKTLEVVDGYSPDVLYFDSKWSGTIDEAHRLEFLAHYYNAAAAQGKDVVVTYKQNDLQPGAGLLDLERGGSADILRPTWQTDDAMDRNSWSWVEPPSLKNETELLGELVDIVSKGGNFLLDVPPKADGSFDERITTTLLSMGSWLGVHGVGIYKSVPWRAYGEGPTKIIPGGFHEWPLFTAKDFRFTAAPDGEAIFLYLMKWVPVTVYSVASLNTTALAPAAASGGSITNVTLMGSPVAIEWTQDGAGLHVGPIPPVPQPNCPVGLRVHLGGAGAAAIDAPTRELRESILRG